MFKNCDLRCKITFDAFHVWPFICIKHCPCITMSPLSHSVIRNITLLLPLLPLTATTTTTITTIIVTKSFLHYQIINSGHLI